MAPAERFRPVVLPPGPASTPAAQIPSATSSARFRPSDPIPETRDRPVFPLRQPRIAQPAPETQKVVPVSQKGSHSASGSASWYCSSSSACTRGYPGGLYAAAGPALRVGDWRGRLVTVSSSGKSVQVRLVDWCQCYGSRVIDLYSDAFRRLAPTSRGVINVTVSW